MSSAWRWPSFGRLLGPLIFLIGWACTPDAAAVPGNAWFALTPAPVPGDFDADAYLSDPAGWPALATEHSRGWSVVYRSSSPPDGWTRPFVLRGGGAACQNLQLRAAYAAALAEMLPARRSAILALLDPPDSAACSPGKPNPHPFLRDDWLGLHDGRLDIIATTMNIWRADLGPDWPEFRTLHPRDYHAKSDSSRGNAGEIAFLLFLYERERAGGAMVNAVRATIRRFLNLPFTHGQLNLLLQSADTTWALRYAADQVADYPVFYGRTTGSEYWIADERPAGAVEWHELPNRALACFPASGSVTIFDLTPSEVVNEDGFGPRTPECAAVRLRARTNPCLGEIRLAFSNPLSGRAAIEVRDPSGRRLHRETLPSGAAGWCWQPPMRVPAGVYWIQLLADGRQSGTQVLWLR